MKTKIYMSALFAVMLTIVTGFGIRNGEKATEQVMVYGIVYKTECKSEAFDYFSYRLVNPKEAYEQENILRAYLKGENPGKRVSVTSSKQFYKDATSMCLITWKGGTKDCSYTLGTVHFGKSPEEAERIAIDHKNSHADSGASFKITERINWK